MAVVHLNLNDSNSIVDAVTSLNFHHWQSTRRFKRPKVSNHLRGLWWQACAGRFLIWFQSEPSSLSEDLLPHFDWLRAPQYQMVHSVPLESWKWDRLGFVASLSSLQGGCGVIMLYTRYHVPRNLSSRYRLFISLGGDILQCIRES